MSKSPSRPSRRRPPRPPERPAGRFGNALLGWELLRVSRRTGALAIGRFAFGAALLGVMWILWSAYYAHSLGSRSGDVNELGKELGRFAQTFALTFFFVQLTLVLLLTPIYVGGSVFEERETRSGEVLLTTDLTRREVFYGKFLARVVQVMMVVAAGMPVLSLTLLWGGVAISFVVLGYAVTFFCILSSGAIAASVAGSSETFREGVLKAYAYTLVFDGLIFPASPYLVIAMASQDDSGFCCGVLFFPVQIVIILVALSHGLRWLRLAMLRQRRRVTEELAEQMARRKPPMPEEDPLLWKERYVSGDTELVSNTLLMAGIGVSVGVAIITLFGIGVLPAGWVAAYAAPPILGVATAVIGLGAAAAVARERQHNTLTDLFMLPGGRTEILKAKLAGAVWRGRWLLASLGALLVISVVSGTPAVAVPVLALAALAFVAFGATLGVYLSVRCRTALNANATWMGLVALSLIGTYLLADAMSHRAPTASGSIAPVYPPWSRVVNPVMAWQELAMNPDDDPPGSFDGLRKWRPRFLPDHSAARLVPPVMGVLIYGVAAAGLWWLAVRRFNREGREE